MIEARQTKTASSPPKTEAREPAGPDLARQLGLGQESAARRWARRLAWTAVATALAVGGGLLYRHLTTPEPVAYETATASIGDVEASVEATGTLQPLRRVEVGPEVSGRIAVVRVDDNDRVRAGDVLAEIDPQPIEALRAEARARRQAARAALQQAIANRDQARRTLARYEPLAGTDAVAGQEIDAARAALEQGEAAVASAGAQIALATASLRTVTTDLARTSIRSPVDGIVLARNAEPGQAVAAAFSPPILFVLAEDLTRMELRLAVDEADIGRVESGQIARFTVDAFPERTFAATVSSVRNAPTTVEGVVTYEVALEVANADGSLRPGMTANATIVTTTERDVLRVPNAALRFTPPEMESPEGSSRVWVLRDGAPVPITVERGITDGRVTAVAAPGLEAGTSVLVDVKHRGP